MNDPHDLGARPRTRQSMGSVDVAPGADHETDAAREREELRAIASLLRDLPDPLPPDSLVPRVLERVAAREARPAVVRLAFRAAGELADRRAGLALAAGAACLLVLASLGGNPIPSLLSTGAGSAALGTPSESRAMLQGTRSSPTGATRPMPARQRRVVVANPQFVSLFNSFPQAPTPRIRLDRGRSEVFEQVDRGLDQQLNRLLLDPTAYCERLANIPQRDAIMARLADRSAARGDAIEVALRVRQAQHPLGRQLSDRFMRAAVEQRFSPR